MMRSPFSRPQKMDALRVSLCVNVLLLMVLLSTFYYGGSRSWLQLDIPVDEEPRSEPSVADRQKAHDDVDEEAPIAAKGPVGDHILPYLTKPYGITKTRHKRSMLVGVQPLWYMQPALGYVDDTDKMDMRDTLLLPADTTRVCIDVGTYVSTPSAKRWWSQDPKTFVVAFEPNYFSSTLLTRVANPIMHSQGRGYWPSCTARNQSGGGLPTVAAVPLADTIHECVEQHLSHVTDNFNRFLLIPVALSYRNEFATFLVGFPGRPDGGSLLTFRPKLRKKKDPPSRIQVGIAQLYPYLRMIPAFLTRPQPGSTTNQTRLLWDTLKIDAQGVDELVIEGGGMLLAHFACIIAELDLRAYNAGHRFEHLPFLIGVLKFIRIGRNTFINPRFRKELLDGSALCTAPDVYHTRDDIVRALPPSTSP